MNGAGDEPRASSSRVGSKVLTQTAAVTGSDGGTTKTVALYSEKSGPKSSTGERCSTTNPVIDRSRAISFARSRRPATAAYGTVAFAV
jgi:hypothetical protein